MSVTIDDVFLLSKMNLSFALSSHLLKDNTSVVFSLFILIKFFLSTGSSYYYIDMRYLSSLKYIKEQGQQQQQQKQQTSLGLMSTHFSICLKVFFVCFWDCYVNTFSPIFT